ncbi:MAG: glycosyltransferase [Candidatus Omnitrophica bacterium]|nr:glycosyltransferase [Candidatus Omnitrophota bacterium]
MMQRSAKISVVMPAFNEANRIQDSLQETINTFDEYKSNYEIIVVDDGSSDDTFQKAQAVAARYYEGRIRVLRNLVNCGKGRAIKKGVRYAGGDYIVFLDADMDLHPGQINTFFDIMRLTNTDIVIGSKMHPNSQLRYPWYRRLMSAVYYYLVKCLFGLPVHDTQTGLKLFKREAARKLFKHNKTKKFAFDLEVLANAHRLGFTIAEAPIILQNQRVFGRIGIRAIALMLIDTFAIFYRMYIRKSYEPKKAAQHSLSFSNASRRARRSHLAKRGRSRAQLAITPPLALHK